MKNVRLLVGLGFAFCLPMALRAEDEVKPKVLELLPPPNPHVPLPPNEDVFMPHLQTFGAQMVKASYVGVGVDEADATLRKQLKLPDGIGLAVRHVDKDGPAAQAGIQQHDLLVKLKDQHLVNLQQFVTLVRMNKPGEKIEISLIREGAPLTVTITVAEKDLPALETYARNNSTMNAAWASATPVMRPFTAGTAAWGGPGGGQFTTQVGEVHFQDDDHHIQITNKDNTPTLIVKGKDGKVEYEGDPKAAPDNIKQLMEKYHVMEMARPNVMFFEHKIIEGPQPSKPIPVPGGVKIEAEKF